MINQGQDSDPILEILMMTLKLFKCFICGQCFVERAIPVKCQLAAKSDHDLPMYKVFTELQQYTICLRGDNWMLLAHRP